jgi:glucose-1-phosphate adenylyltransferase
MMRPSHSAMSHLWTNWRSHTGEKPMNASPTALSRTQTFILAGGQGERLGSLTVARPKPGVSFGGMFRIIDFTLSNCLHSGLRHVSVLTQYRHEALHDYIKQGWGPLWGEIRGSNKSLVCLPPASGKRYRGTADAVFQNLSLLEDKAPEFVIILSGDHVYHMDYTRLLGQHIDTNADLTLATVPHPVKGASQFGIVEFDRHSRVVGFVEKPANPQPIPSNSEMALVNMGVYIFKADVLTHSLLTICERGIGTDFGRDVIPALIPSHQVFAYEYCDDKSRAPLYWRDIGTIDSYYQASMDVLHSDAPFDPFFNENEPAKPTRHPALNGIAPAQARVHESAQVKRSVVSPGVTIRENAIVKDSILMPGVHVGEGAQLRTVIVEENVRIPAGFRAGFDLDGDRRFHLVTETGVVVVGKIEDSSTLETRRAGPAAQMTTA